MSQVDKQGVFFFHLHYAIINNVQQPALIAGLLFSRQKVQNYSIN